MEAPDPNLGQLPRRPKQSKHIPLKTYEIITNHFKVEIPQMSSIFMHMLSVAPGLSSDNRQVQMQIIKNLKDKISDQVGPFVCSGQFLFSIQKPKFDPSVTMETIVNQVTFRLTITHKKIIEISDRSDSSEAKSKNLLKFFNILFKNYLTQLQYT